MAWKSSAVAAHSEPPSIFFYRCWSGVCGKGYEDVVLECLRASGASRAAGEDVVRASGASRAAASVAPHASVAQVLWSNTFQQKLVEAMPAGALCNHFPRSTELSHKHRLCRWMRRSARCRRFTPRGFVLPDEAAEWATAAAAAERLEAKVPPPPPPPPPPSPSPTPRPQQQPPQQQQQQQQRLWIVKPAQAGSGRHVRVLGGAAAVGEEAARCAASKQLKRASHSAVAQEYVERPLLIRGRKFDLRLYVLVTDVGGNASAAATSGGGGAAASVAAGLGKAPPRAFLFREGFVRFASEAYSLAPPFSKFAHLTNNAVNRKNVAGGEASLANWSLSQLSSWMQHARSGSGGGTGEGSGVGGGFEAQVWGGVRELVAAVLLGVSVPLADALLQAKARVSEAGGGRGNQTAEQAAAAGREEGRAGGSNSSSSSSSNSFGCFELFGFDVLIDEELRPWLLEVNAQPALGVGGALDMAIDRAMLQALFGIVLGDDSPAAAAASAPAHPLPTAHDFDRLPHPALCVFEDLAVELAAAAE